MHDRLKSGGVKLCIIWGHTTIDEDKRDIDLNLHRKSELHQYKKNNFLTQTNSQNTHRN